MILFVNNGLEGLLTLLAKFERHQSVSDQAASLSTKMFLTQFINTGVTTLLCSGAITGFGEGTNPLASLYILSGQHTDFTRPWYAGVGAGLTLELEDRLNDKREQLLEKILILEDTVA